jgi:hypothetical protein
MTHPSAPPLKKLKFLTAAKTASADIMADTAKITAASTAAAAMREPSPAQRYCISKFSGVNMVI